MVGWRVFFKNGAVSDFNKNLTKEEVKEISERDFDNEINKIIKL